MLRACVSSGLLFGMLAPLPATDPSPGSAIERLMRAQNAAVKQVHLLHRAQVDPQLNLVIAVGIPRNWKLSPSGGSWWDKESLLGIFLQRRDNPGMIYKIVIEPGPGPGPELGACHAQVERATATDVVMSCTPEKGGPAPNQKFVYDLRAKALVKRISYQPFAMRRMFVSGQNAVLVGSDNRSLIALEYDPAREPAFHLLGGAQAERWTHHETILLDPKEFKPVQFGPGNRFRLSREEESGPAASYARLIVTERIGGAVKRFPLPESTYDEFSAARPGRVRNGYLRESTTIDEKIGPCQMFDGTLWFAKTFYDGEGNTGVGGFGYFDTAARSYQFFSPPEIRDYSVTALLVEPDVAWLGLAAHGDWGGVGGGVLQFDRTTQAVKRLPLREIAGEIVRVGDRLLIATATGGALFDGSNARRFFIDEMTDGRLRVAEALPVAASAP